MNINSNSISGDQCAHSRFEVIASKDYISSFQSLSCVWFFAAPWITACQASLSITSSGVYPNSCPLSRWCHPAISSSVVPFSSSPQSLPASGSFPMSQRFAWGGQSTGVSASVLPMNTQDWFPLELTELILCLRTGGNTYQLGVKSVFFFFFFVICK